MAEPVTPRFTVHEGEIVDTKMGQIIPVDRFNKLSTPEEKSSIESQLSASNVAVSETPPSFYGLREDGTSKGNGFFGPLRSTNPDYPQGTVSTEINASMEIDGEEVLFPLLVPTLNRKEIEHLLSGEKPTQQIYDKALAHAEQRLRQGKSPFAEDGEVGQLPNETSSTQEASPRTQSQLRESGQMADAPEVVSEDHAPEPAVAEEPAVATDHPSLEQFIADVKPLNPGYSDEQLASAYQTRFAERPKDLRTWEDFHNEVKPLNPDYSDDQIKEAWQQQFGQFGAREENSSLTRRTLGDTAVGLVKGLAALPSAALGLIDIPTGGEAGKFTKDVITMMGVEADRLDLPTWARPSQWTAQLGDLYSPESQAAMRHVSERAREAQASAEGVGGKIVASAGGALSGLVENPSAIIPLAAENYGGMKVIAAGVAKFIAPLQKELDAAVKAGTITEVEASRELSLAAIKSAALGEGVLTSGQGSSAISAEQPDTDFAHRLAAAAAGLVTGAITLGVGDRKSVV